MLRMDIVDRIASRNIMRAMGEAGIDLDQLSAASGLTVPVLVKRLSQGSFSLREFVTIAQALGRRTSELVPDEAAA